MTTPEQQPTPAVVDQDASWRAIEYHAEQLWDATRGLLTAYKVKTGDPGQVDPVLWRDLTENQRLAFTVTIGPAVDILARAVDHVMVCLRGKGGRQ